MRSAIALLALALAAQAAPVERDLTTTTLTATATNTTTTTTTTTTTATQLTTQTDHARVTDHRTIVDHTTTTQVITKTAYVLANAPAWADQAQPFATLAPDVIPHNSNSGTGGAPAPAPAASPSPAGGAVVVNNPNTSPAQSSALSQAQDAAPTLMPTQPNQVDPNSLNNLKPTNSSPLAFTQNGTTTDGSMPFIFAEANATYQYPTVVLPHTNYVSSMTCTPTGLQVNFSSKQAYDFVKANWKTVPFLLITESLHCNAADNGLQVYWLVSKLGYDDGKMVVQVTASEIAVENALKQINIIWRQYSPSGQTDGTSWSGTAPNTGSTGGSATGGGGSGGGSGGSGGSNPVGNGSTSESTSGSTSGNNGGSSGTGGGGSGPAGGSSGSSGTSGSGSTGGSNAGGSNGASSSGNSPTNGASTTYGPNSTLSCLSPPSTYMGLPTAPCGDNFDTILDQRIGYLDPDSPAFATDFFPGDPNVKTSDFQERGVLPRHLAARRWRWGNPLRAMTNVVRSGVSAVKTAVVQTVNTVVNEVKSAAQKLVDIVADGLKAVGNPSFSKTIPIKIVPGTEVDSVFGTANSVLVYSGTKASTSGNAQASVSVYCVDCGVRGSTTLGGALGFSIIPPAVTKAEVSIAGSIKAGANLGLVASGQYTGVFKKNLVTVPIPGAGIAIANIVTVGAAVTLDAVATVNVAASGQLLVGASVEFPNFNAKLDAIGSNSGVSVFEPVFTKTFKAEGEISASLGLGLPAEIAVGITVPSIKFDKRIGLRNTPELTAAANFKGATDGINTDASICYNIGISDSMDVNLIGRLVPLQKIEKPNLFADCITLAGSGKGNTPVPDTSATGGTVAPGGSSDAGGTTNGSGTTPSTGTDPTGTGSDAGASSPSGSTGTSPTGNTASGSTGSSGTGSTTADGSGTGSASGSTTGSTGSAGSTGTNTNSAGTGTTGASGSTDSTGTAPTGSTGSASSTPAGGSGAPDANTNTPPPSDNASGSSTGSSASVPPTDTTVSGSSSSAPAPVERRDVFERADNSTTSGASSITTSTTTTNTTSANVTSTANTTTSADSTSSAVSPSVALPKVAPANLTAPDLTAVNNLFDDTTGPGFDDALNAALNSSTNATDAADEDPGFNYISLLDITGSFALANNEEGNLFLAPASSASSYTFASYDNVVVGTGVDFVFFYYSDEISTLGVSRFRMNDYTHIPKTADLVTLIPLDADTSSDTPGIYVAADTKGNILYPVVCSISGLESKVFLVTDPDSGVKKLTQPELQYVITGGPVSSCSLLALKTTNNFGGF